MIAKPITANAYETGIHFYMTYAMAYWCGLDNGSSNSEAYQIAWADYSTDMFYQTDAGSHIYEWLDPSKLDNRRIFHFAVPKDSLELVKRGSDPAWLNANLAIDEATPQSSNPLLLGLGLHTLQDSYAHEGYSPIFGHWTLDPDWPDTDIPKLLEAAESTWLAIDRWSRKAHGKGCTAKFDQVAGLLETWAHVPSHDTDSILQTWRKDVEALALKSIPTTAYDDNDQWSDAFSSAADHIVDHFYAQDSAPDDPNAPKAAPPPSSLR